MFKIAVIVGIYSYLILTLGIFGLLTIQHIFITSLSYGLVVVFFLRKQISISSALFLNKKETSLCLLLALLVFVNVIGVLGPELAFDALWYHLTIPKLFILNERIAYIPGNLLYYSVMPMLTEMLYIPALLMGSEIYAKLIHFFFGLLTCIVIYRFSRLYISKFYSLLAVVIFYSNLVVGWLSITAFADLSRTFFEILALYLFARFIKERKSLLFYQSAVTLGFAVCAKVLSLPSVLIYMFLLFVFSNTMQERLGRMFEFSMIVIIVSLPWFLFAYLSTGNPIFPIFSNYYNPELRLELLTPISFISSTFSLLLFSPDPLSPIYLILLPLFVYNFKKLYSRFPVLVIYTLVSFVLWYFTPQSGGGRFITAFLPAYSIISSILIDKYSSSKTRYLIALVIAIAVISVGYRGIANSKFISPILGITTREEFLMNHLNFAFGDFYDEDGQIKKLVGSNKVLLIGIHNLYYVDFPYDLDSWNRKGSYKYILVHNDSSWDNPMYRPIYVNEKTHVTLYELNE